VGQHKHAKAPNKQEKYQTQNQKHLKQKQQRTMMEKIKTQKMVLFRLLQLC
jgi:hypothetical protein